MEHQGYLVSMLVSGTAAVVMWRTGVISILIESPDPPSAYFLGPNYGRSIRRAGFFEVEYMVCKDPRIELPYFLVLQLT